MDDEDAVCKDGFFLKLGMEGTQYGWEVVEGWNWKWNDVWSQDLKK